MGASESVESGIRDAVTELGEARAAYEQMDAEAQQKLVETLREC
ncbi:hypothetical protein ACH347_28910 [Saccharopolyspora sp. 5N102]